MFSWLLFVMVLATWIISTLLGGDMKSVAAAAVITAVMTPLALVVSVIPHNQSLEKRAESLVAEDHDDGTRPVADVIAVRDLIRTNAIPRDTHCEGFCMRALLNGVAKQVLLTTEDSDSAIDPSKTVDSYRMERLATCPFADLRSGDVVGIEGESRKALNNVNIHDIMKREIAGGNCLISEKLPLGIADVVLSKGDVRSDNDRRARSSLGHLHIGNHRRARSSSWSADTLTAERITMHEKRGGSYVETFRKTYALYKKLTPLYFQKYVGYDKGRMDWSGFLTGRMGYDLALRNPS